MADEARRASGSGRRGRPRIDEGSPMRAPQQGKQTRSVCEKNPEVVWFKSHLRNQKRFHSRYNFGYGILIYIRKTAHFRPFTAHFGGFEGIFSYISNKSAILCPGKTEVADFVSFKGSIVQGIKIYKKMLFYVEKCDITFLRKF